MLNYLYYVQSHPWLIALIMVWVLFWKGYALWIAARNSSRWWFIVLMIVNTFGLLEIIFIFGVAKKTPKDLTNSLKTRF
jgi:hypothetical protein